MSNTPATITSKKVIRLYVGSNKPMKAKAILLAFQEMLPDCEFILDTIHVNTGVPSQPFNKAVFRGVTNRINALRKIVKEMNSGEIPENCIFAVCEAGILKHADGNSYNVQVVGILPPNSNHIVTGLSPGLLVPRKQIWKMRFQKLSISDVFQKHLGTKRGMEHLTNGQFDRMDLITKATVMALAGIKFENSKDNFINT